MQRALGVSLSTSSETRATVRILSLRDLPLLSALARAAAASDGGAAPSIVIDETRLRSLVFDIVLTPSAPSVPGDADADDVAAAAGGSALALPPAGTGWERNEKSKMGPRQVDLARSLDPRSLAESSVDLNLKLMRWRILPELNLDAIQRHRCLLLGAGTLGCVVARSLLAWGVRDMTLVDCGRVSFRCASESVAWRMRELHCLVFPPSLTPYYSCRPCHGVAAILYDNGYSSLMIV